MEHNLDALVAAVKDYTQADEQGIMVLVSRQACDEAAAALVSLRDKLAEVNEQWEIVCNAYVVENQRLSDRAEKAEAELAAAQKQNADWKENYGRAIDAALQAPKVEALQAELAAALRMIDLMAAEAQRSPPRELWAIASKYLDCYVRQVNVIGGLQEADADRAYLSQLEDAAPQTDAKIYATAPTDTKGTT